MKIVFFDIETRTKEGDSTGHTAFTGEGGISVAVTMADEDGITTIRLWDATSVEELVLYLEDADLVVSWNGEGFDLPILSYLIGRRVAPKMHIDLCREVRRAAGKRLRLGELAKATLSLEKSGNGADAPEMAARGEWGKLYEYCTQDVNLLRGLYQYARQYGILISADATIAIGELYTCHG